jgi:hypothetical protein
MSDVAADKLFERILRSLKENSADFVREKRARRNVRIRQTVYVGVVFVAGIALGALLMKVL